MNEAQIVAKICKLRSELGNYRRESDAGERQDIMNMICLLERDLREITERRENGKIYGKARVVIQSGGGERKEVNVIIKDRSCTNSFSGETYIVSRESMLACAISKTNIGSVAIYKNGNGGVETAVRIIEKDF